MATPTPITGPCAWLGHDMARSARWVRELAPEHLTELDVRVGKLRPQAQRLAQAGLSLIQAIELPQGSAAIDPESWIGAADCERVLIA